MYSYPPTLNGAFKAFLISNLFAVSVVLILMLVARHPSVPSYVTRKLLHSSIGIVFAFFWRIFPVNFTSPQFPFLSPGCVAAIIPASITLIFALVGTKSVPDPGLTPVMARNAHHPEEILRGPLIYGIIHTLLPIVFWVHTPAAVIAISFLCAGDGSAEICGRAWCDYRAKKGKQVIRWPWSQGRKTLFGSLGFLIFGYITCVFLIYNTNSMLIEQKFNPLDVLVFDVHNTLDWIKLFVVDVIAMVVESLPLREVDNITVPVTAVVVSLIFWH